MTTQAQKYATQLTAAHANNETKKVSELIHNADDDCEMRYDRDEYGEMGDIENCEWVMWFIDDSLLVCKVDDDPHRTYTAYGPARQAKGTTA